MLYSSSGSNNNNNFTSSFNCNSFGRGSLNSNIFGMNIKFYNNNFKIISFDYYNNIRYKKKSKSFYIISFTNKILCSILSSCRSSSSCGSSVLVVVVVVVLGIMVLVLVILL